MSPGAGEGIPREGRRPLRVLLSTSWGTACGIAEHSACLKAAVEAADPGIVILPSSLALDPKDVVLDGSWGAVKLVHLNHHDALHSRWTPQHVEQFRSQGIPVVVTYHDSRERLEDCPKLAAMSAVASATIVHEPVEGLEGKGVHYWRQGVPAPASAPVSYAYNHDGVWQTDSAPPAEYQEYLRRPGFARYLTPIWKAFPQQPVLGTVGFNFPWKNYDRLAHLTREAGWALVLLANNATPDDIARWKQLNPSTLVLPEFLDQPTVLNYLAGCDATVFYYTCANTGTSGAVRQGIAARKPVIAFEGCRQFRDLYEDPLGFKAITWVDGEGDLRATLREVRSGGIDPLVHALAEQDSWRRLGETYAHLYRELTV